MTTSCRNATPWRRSASTVAAKSSTSITRRFQPRAAAVGHRPRDRALGAAQPELCSRFCVLRAAAQAHPRRRTHQTSPCPWWRAYPCGPERHESTTRSGSLPPAPRVRSPAWSLRPSPRAGRTRFASPRATGATRPGVCATACSPRRSQRLGLDARGVDADADMVAYARGDGLEVEQADALVLPGSATGGPRWAGSSCCPGR